MKRQFSTFFIDDSLFGVDVMDVQEVTLALPMTQVPLAPDYVRGLINLRGQLATAVGLEELFAFEKDGDASQKKRMNVVCKGDGILVSLLVDRIGDVIEVGEELFESTPDTVPKGVGRFMSGVYKTPEQLLSILEVKEIVNVIQK